MARRCISPLPTKERALCKRLSDIRRVKERGAERERERERKMEREREREREGERERERERGRERERNVGRLFTERV